MQGEEKKGKSWEVGMAVVQGYAATIYPFMRRNCGRNHPGILGLIGIGWLLLWVMYTRAEGLLLLIPAYIAGQCLYLMGGKWKGIHSNYGGEPFVAMKLGFKTETSAKRFGEPIISAVFGWALLLCGYDEGKYFIYGAAAMMATQAMIDDYDRQRVEAMQDGAIEGRYYSAKLLNGRNGHVRN